MSQAINITVNADQSIVTIDIPITFKRRGGKKTIIAPDGHAVNDDRNEKQDRILLKTLVNAHKWQRMLDSGKYESISKLCEGEDLSKGYTARVIRMVTLAPNIQEKILNMQCPGHLYRENFVKAFPAGWDEQRRHFGIT